MKKIESITPVHHYGGKLIIGDVKTKINFGSKYKFKPD